MDSGQAGAPQPMTAFDTIFTVISQLDGYITVLSQEAVGFNSLLVPRERVCTVLVLQHASMLACWPDYA